MPNTLQSAETTLAPYTLRYIDLRLNMPVSTATPSGTTLGEAIAMARDVSRNNNTTVHIDDDEGEEICSVSA